MKKLLLVLAILFVGVQTMAQEVKIVTPEEFEAKEIVTIMEMRKDLKKDVLEAGNCGMYKSFIIGKCEEMVISYANLLKERYRVLYKEYLKLKRENERLKNGKNEGKK